MTPKPETLNPEREMLNSDPLILNPPPSTLHLRAARLGLRAHVKRSDELVEIHEPVALLVEAGHELHDDLWLAVDASRIS